MATHHWMIILSIKHHVQVEDTWVAGEWATVDRGGKVMEMLVKMAEVLV